MSWYASDPLPAPLTREDIKRAQTSTLITTLAAHAARVEMARVCLAAIPSSDERNAAEAIAEEIDDRLPGKTAW